MYIDWQSKRTKATLRFLVYALMTVVTIATTVALVYMAKGYSLNRKTGEIVQNGLLLIDSDPVSATIRIDDREFNKTPGRYILPVGDYSLSLSAAGYRQWQKEIHIKGSSVKQVYYPRLFPTDIETVSVFNVKQPEIFNSSDDNKYILLREKNDLTKLATIYPAKSINKPILIAWPENLPKAAGGQISLSTVEWSPDGSRVLLKYVRGKSVEFLSVATKTGVVTNLTRDLNSNIQNPRYLGKSGSRLYAMVGSDLYRYDLSDLSKPPVSLMAEVRSYEPYGDNVILFAKQVDEKIQVGIINKTKVYYVEELPLATNKQIALGYREYSDKQYFVVASGAKPQLRIYTNPLQADALATPKPSATLNIPRVPGRINFSPSGQFMMFQHGSQFIVYDFDSKQVHDYKTPLDITTQKAIWMDGAHLTTNLNGKIYVWDFDNSNLQLLITSNTTYHPVFSNNFVQMWTIGQSVDKKAYSLQLSSLDAKKTPQSFLPEPK